MDANTLFWWIFIFVLFFGGGGSVLANRWMEHRRAMARLKAEAKQPPKLPPPPPTICGCTHSLAFHSLDGGPCQELVSRPTAWKTVKVELDDVEDFPDAEQVGLDRDEFGYTVAVLRMATKWEQGQCRCVRYVGPEPLMTLSAPELSDVAMDTPKPPQAVHGRHSAAQAPVYESTFTYEPGKENR